MWGDNTLSLVPQGLSLLFRLSRGTKKNTNSRHIHLANISALVSEFVTGFWVGSLLEGLALLEVLPRRSCPSSCGGLAKERELRTPGFQTRQALNYLGSN